MKQVTQVCLWEEESGIRVVRVGLYENWKPECDEKEQLCKEAEHSKQRKSSAEYPEV